MSPYPSVKTRVAAMIGLSWIADPKNHDEARRIIAQELHAARADALNAAADELEADAKREERPALRYAAGVVRALAEKERGA